MFAARIYVNALLTAVVQNKNISIVQTINICPLQIKRQSHPPVVAAVWLWLPRGHYTVVGD